MALEERRVTDAEGFRALAPDWNELLARSGHPTPFLSHEWLRAWWTEFGRGRLQLVTLWDGGRLVGAAPLYRDRGPWGSTALRLLGAGQSDYLDFLADREAPGDLYAALLDAAMPRDGADLLLLEQVPKERISSIRDFSRDRGMFLQVKPRGHCYAAPLPARWEDYLETLGKNERYNLRRRRRALAERGVSYRRLSRLESDLEPRVDEFFGLMTRRLSMRGRRLSMEAESSRRFHREVAARFAERGWLNLGMLVREDRMIAGLFAFEYGRTIFYYHSGFDPDWSKYSVGMVLLSKCMEDGIGRGMTVFDFMRGRAGYKAAWKVEEREFSRVSMARTPADYLRLVGDGAVSRVRKRWAGWFGRPPSAAEAGEARGR